MIDDDYMELGELNLIPTEYGFVNAETGEKYDHYGEPIVDET